MKEEITDEWCREAAFSRKGYRVSIDCFIDKIYDKDENGRAATRMSNKYRLKANHKPFDLYLKNIKFKLHSTAWRNYELPKVGDYVVLRFPHRNGMKEESEFQKGVIIPSDESIMRCDNIEQDDDATINLDIDDFITLKDYDIDELINELKERGCTGSITFTKSYTL